MPDISIRLAAGSRVFRLIARLQAAASRSPLRTPMPFGFHKLLKGIFMPASSSTVALFSLALALGLAVTPENADAAVMTRVTGGNAANFCQSALPVFDVQIRKRPLAVQNEGTTSAFVTCAFNSFSQTRYVAVYFSSTTGTPWTLTCTGINGTNEGGAKYVVKDIILTGDGTQTKSLWSAADFGGEFEGGGEFGISCNLPPGMGINQMLLAYDEVV